MSSSSCLKELYNMGLKECFVNMEMFSKCEWWIFKFFFFIAVSQPCSLEEFESVEIYSPHSLKWSSL